MNFIFQGIKIPRIYIWIAIFFNSFSADVSLLYLLKTSENRRFSDIFRGYRSGTLVGNGLSTLNGVSSHMAILFFFGILQDTFLLCSILLALNDQNY